MFCPVMGFVFPHRLRFLSVISGMVFLSTPISAMKIDSGHLQIGLGYGNTSGTYQDGDLSAQLSGNSQSLFHFSEFHSSNIAFTSGMSSSQLSGEAATSKSRIEFDYRVTFLELSYGYAFELGFFRTEPSIMLGLGKSTFEFKVISVEEAQLKSPPRDGTPAKVFAFLPVYFLLGDHFFIGFHISGGITMDRFEAGSSKASLEIKDSMHFVMGGGF